MIRKTNSESSGGGQARPLICTKHAELTDLYGGTLYITATCKHYADPDNRNPELEVKFSLTGQYGAKAWHNDGSNDARVSIQVEGGESATLPQALRIAADMAEEVLYLKRRR